MMKKQALQNISTEPSRLNTKKTDHSGQQQARELSDGQDLLGLALTPRALGPRLKDLRFLVLSTCQAGFLAVLAPEFGYSADHMLYDSATFTPIPDVDPAPYDAVVVGLVFRHFAIEVFPQSVYDLGYVRITDVDEARALLDRFIDVMRRRVDALHERFKAKPTFFMSFLEPSFNYLGNLVFQPGALSPKWFVRQLNLAFEEYLHEKSNFYFLDANEAISAVGSRHLQDDISTSSVHASIIGDWDDQHDGNRLTKPTSLLVTYDTKQQLKRLAAVLFNTLADNVKIIRQVDSVKLIIVDLDDTLWRGVAAEDSMPNYIRTEGWPAGFIEALLFFKRRGGLLAISSKNEHDATIKRFKEIWGDRITVDDFVAVKINWSPKSESISEILSETNILAKNALFIDDNPREIDEVKSQIPDIRCLSGTPYDWRRIILQSPETQVPFISNESRQRTEMVKARINREVQAKTVDRDEWLRSLNIQETVTVIQSTSDRQFPRTMELINKTNQFNTTGKRWELGEFESLFQKGGMCLLAALKDKTIDNGIIGIAIVRPGAIEQVVLSCRVFGLGAETVLGSIATTIALKGNNNVEGQIYDTGRNFACHTYFTDLGFEKVAEGKFRATKPCAYPSWIEVVMGTTV